MYKMCFSDLFGLLPGAFAVVFAGLLAAVKDVVAYVFTSDKCVILTQ